MKPFEPGVEVFEQIFQELDSLSLTRVARVSKTCHNAAIHCLWEALDDGAHLINLLPQECFHRDGKDFILNPICPSYLTRFSIYARHIRYIAFNARSPLLYAFFELLSKTDTTFDLFHSLSGLSTITWAMTSPSQVSGILVLISSALQEPHFLINSKSLKPLRRLPDAIVLAKPKRDARHNIRFPFGTSIFSREDPPSNPTSTSTKMLNTRASIASQSGLTKSLLPPTAPSPFDNHTVAALDEFLDWDNLDPKNIPNCILPSLCKLPMQTTAFWTHMLNYDGQRVRKIDISRLDIPMSASEFCNILQTIGYSCCELTALDLEVELHDHSDEALEGFLTPLLQCTKLQVFNINSYQDLSASLSDNDVEQLAAACPDLTSFELTSVIDWDPATLPPPLTCQSLFSLGRHCPKIQSIVLTMDLRSIPMPTSVIVTANDLDICFWNSSIDDPFQLASALLGFVNAGRVSWNEGQGPFGEEEGEESKKRETLWRCTQSVLRAMQSAKVERAMRRELESSFKTEKAKMEDTIRELRLVNHSSQTELDSVNFNLLSAMGSD